MLPLDDVTVLDLSHALAGPFASTMLGDFGARVIKIEPPTGDIARAWGPPFYGSEPSYVVGLHRNKRSMVIDFKHAEGKELFFKLVERADVVLENYRVGVMDKLGLGYEAAKARNPRIIYCSVSGFGQSGPYRDRAALDLILQAESGMMSVTGEDGGRGVRAGVSIADMTAGMYAAYGIMLALHARGRTGQGQQIDVSMLEGQMSLLQTMIGAYLADGQVPAPMGTAYKALLPYQTFRTKSKDLALAVGSEKLWKDFCPLIGAPEMTDDPRWHNNRARGQNRASLIARLQDIFLTKTYEEWEAILVPAGIPMGAINTIDRVVEHPQVRARNVLVESEHPTAGTVKVVGPPVRLSETPGRVERPAPLLGEHTAAVLREHLGLDDAEIERLRRSGAIHG
ncbi:MAG: CoA transferase [Candidatus Rokubacteria bacterium]|nr:CoA transferase [Candidatus Rokubacteria bacterium]